jgi:DNA-binding transcriptional LysR family regulator
VSGNFHADNPFVVREAAIEGAGIAFLPSFVIADDVKAGRLHIVLEEFAAETGWIYLAFPSARPSRLARAFGDFVSVRVKETLG